MSTSNKSEKINILVYGFDMLGYQNPSEPLNISTNIKIQFSNFSVQLNLDDFNGVIIPQGIFESIERSKTSIYTYYDIKVETDLLYEREREVINLLKQDNWICFLVSDIIDAIPQGGRTKNIKDTDLCKRVLNSFNIRRRRPNVLTYLESKSNEFLEYIKEYGVAKNVFDFIQSNTKPKVLITSGRATVGFEIKKKIFVIPFHTTKINTPTLRHFSKTIANAILDYRQKNIILLPSWLNSFQFEKEKFLDKEIDNLKKKLADFQIDLKKWQEYKSILIISGDLLRDKIVIILEDFFKFKVDPNDEGIEDAKIVDENLVPIFMLEIKGSKKGIKREHINQVDSHRERNNLPTSIPGILFINNKMDVVGIENKLKTTVPKEHIKHAKRLNVLIIRTIDLLYLMKHLERETNKRKEVMANLLNSGGGWLSADLSEYKIID